ncbi:MAG TPA: tRNA preQ1(34) S-adenosylmethionine ribosyltransferase-isomerase QueA [Gemmatimonadaceae bacterium]|nr:tRNA preQ1(34) S-adenosylmethionine ribosyltransferase-isomerase QueA [Gemmatimonadaceae bacterium]
MIGTRTADYDYALPPDRIAQTPVEPRDASRLMVIDRATGSISHRRFHDLPELVQPADLLVVNTTRVMRARLLGHRDSGAPAEILLLKQLKHVPSGTFEAMVHPGGKLKPGRVVHIAPDLDVEIVAVTDRRTRVVRLHTSLPHEEAIERYGHVPLPPYIDRADVPADGPRYQTVYAEQRGSVAAPTAGLHFTPELLARLPHAEVVLHVGAGTFKPVEVDDPAAHVMHEEWYSIPSATQSAIAATRANGGAVWAVGTTSARALESGGTEGETRLFIRPPYQFRVVDRLITNFHLPRSTLLMLVAAFAGYDLMMRAYREAIATGYRFYSYGDAMAIV